MLQRQARNAQRLARMLSSQASPPLTVESINSKLVEAQYAVRGNVLAHATALEKDLKEGKLPFKEFIQSNIGNPHALLQKPLSFNRQVISLCMNPELLDIPGLYKPDVVERAKKYLAASPGGIGAYTNSQGRAAIRKEIAEFIQKRDGPNCPPVDPERIFLTNGASDGVRVLYKMLLRDASDGYRDGILTPIPQYPLYSARAKLTGSDLVPYYLDETGGWSATVPQLREALQKGRDAGTCVRAIVVINPGNPTGQVLREQDIKDIVTFAAEENLAIIADEVYQENIWRKDRPFVSVKRAACDLGFTGEPGDHRLQIFSLHSTSKGYLGECGFRGGYMEVHGVPDDVHAQMYKLACISLCSNVSGQLMTGLMVNPPAPGQPSYEQWAAERDAVLASMSRRGKMLTDALNALEGVSCQPAEGAMYAFPRLTSLPPKAIAAAEAKGVPADEFYCLKMLEKTGIIMVPGSGFGQEEETMHLRLTFLPQESDFPALIAALTKGHKDFLKDYA